MYYLLFFVFFINKGVIFSVSFVVFKKNSTFVAKLKIMSTIKESPYTAAITGGGFLFTETNALLPLLQSADREALLKDEKLNNRLLKINAETSRNRAIAEIARRYDAMPASYWEDYKNMNEDDQQVALFLSSLRLTRFALIFTST